MIMDILNNLLLHKEPKKKVCQSVEKMSLATYWLALAKRYCSIPLFTIIQEALDRHARMRFTLQLSNIQDPRKPIQLQQNRVRLVDIVYMCT